MPGEAHALKHRSPAQHHERAEHLLERAATADQSMAGFALAQALAAEALVHATLALGKRDLDEEKP